MPLTPAIFPRLWLTAAGIAAADQIALAALPLAAVLSLDADPARVGQFVAAQGGAWLLVSLPGGVLVDRLSPGRTMPLAAALAAIGAASAALAILAGWGAALAGACFVASAGAVLFMLALNAATPLVVPRAGLPRANARLELARAAMTLAAPVLAGFLAARGHVAGAFGLAAGAALVATIASSPLALAAPKPPGARPPLLGQIREGAAFALAEPVLRGILVCALFWNVAFFALMAAFTPYALTILRLSPEAVGAVIAAMGAGSLLAASLAPAIFARLAPRVILVGGPALSVLAATLIAAAPLVPGPVLPACGFFLVGFGPMLWLICQTSLRQIVTPAPLLGRVGAAIQVAIYGSRPLGALAGGALGAAHGLESAIAFAGACFLASLTSALLSPLARMERLPEAA